MIERESVGVGELTLGYRAVGEGPLAVCLHGFPDHPRGFDPLLRSLAGAGYRAVAPGLRGYAPSGLAPGYSVVACARDVLGLADALGAEELTLIGNDWGALIALVVNGLAPARVRAVVTLAQPHPATIVPTPGLAWRMRHFPLLSVPGLNAWWTARRRYAYLRTLIRRWSPQWRGADELFDEARAQLADPARLRAALAYYAGFSRWPWPALRVSRRPVETPLLMVAGDADGTFDAEVHRRAQRARPEVALAWIANGGHFLHREAPEAVADAILTFLEAVTADGRAAGVRRHPPGASPASPASPASAGVR